MTNGAISVSIVLYKTPRTQIAACMRSLRRCAPSLTIYVVDNSPTEDLSTAFSGEAGVEYTHCPSNPGFGAGHNIAILKSQRAGFVYHLVLNADVHFECDVLTPMRDYMDQNPQVGHMMPKVLNPDGSVQRLCKLVPTPVDLVTRRFMGRRYRARRNAYFEMHGSGYSSIMFVPYLSGCFMLLRQSALRDVGVFDERFFMYPEDIDLTRRIAERYETLFFPVVSVFHEHGAASHKSLRMLWIHLVNIWRYFNKWGWLWDPARARLNKRALSQAVVSAGR